MLGEKKTSEVYGNEGANTPIYRYSVVTDLIEVPADAVPEDFLGVDGADEELPHKISMAHTEQDVSGSGEDSIHGSRKIALSRELKEVLDSLNKCRSPKEEHRKSKCICGFLICL